MNQRPSTSSVSASSSLTGEHRVVSLRRRLLAFVGLAAVLVLGGATYIGLTILQRSIAGDENARIVNAASLSKQLVDRVLSERSRQVELIASSPEVIAAAKKGGDASRQRALPGKAIPELEAMFKATRSQQVDAAARGFLTDIEAKLDIAEVMVTDEYGYNAVITAPSNDFVQSDEGWWKTAWANGATSAQAKYDSATKSTVVELSGAIRDRSAKVGVVKVKFGLSLVDSVLTQGSGSNTLRIDLVDSLGQVIASSGAGSRFRPFGAFASIDGRDGGDAFTYSDSTRQRGAVASTNGGRWRIVAHMSEEDAGHAYSVARNALVGGVVVMLALIIASLYFVGQFIERRITGPAADLARVAEAVAAGDLSRHVSHTAADDEIGRLAAAVSSMIAELRRLAAALNESTAETASMTAEITASSEEMAASAGQIAHTAADLSQQSNLMAETIQALAGSSERLVGMAAQLDAGATEGAERNARLRSLALANRSRLDASTQSLSALSTDAEASAAAIEQLAEASEEIRSFVTLVQKLARQSKLLALNAAMEAARAGEHGHGFAVVAEEVRRLSAMSSDAAERTERVVNGVLNGIAQSRSTSERTVATVRTVRGATEEGSRSFGDIERAVAEADGWTSSIQHTVSAANGLARDMRGKLDSLASGTESFAAAMQEVAASSEEQSASTEQIAAAASTLSAAAERLSRVVANLRLDGQAAPAPEATSRPSGGVRVPADVGIGRPTPARATAKI
jgi:methyl-accepting chemotaxis protein